jgi:hypothetical protein
MHIYDKRVENVFLNTNKMFDSLTRINTNESNDNAVEGDEQEEKN